MEVKPRPLIMPDSFDGEASWDKWVSHFDTIACINEWNNQAKLLWLEARLTGKAKKAWNRLPGESKATYSEAKAAL